ncbi:MAG: Txe/YoeB family addiction module toxin [Bacilli bacterium]|nr:Txe/YoeB family addiction module toxin [Bacilli bacterium]
MWAVLFTKNAEKDKPKLKAAGLEKKTKSLLILLSENPFQAPPSYEKLVGDLNGYYSRRINIQHRLVYRVDSKNNIVIVHSM